VRIATILDRLDAAVEPNDLDLPGLGFHPLKGQRKGEFAVMVTRNWRITFGWVDGDAVDVDLEDYH
jgi:proteic killer suppression protein